MAYTAHVVITIPAANIPGSVTDYPLLVSGTYSYLATVANGGAVTSSVGDDIIFTSDAAGTVMLDFERVFYRATDGTVEYRVRTQAVSGVDLLVYCFYGNAAIVSYQGNNSGTWASAWRAVWHFGDGTTLSGTDSTGNANNGTVSGASAATGKIDGAASFTSAAHVINLTNTSSLRVSPVFVFRCWVNVTSRNTNGSVIIFLFDSLGNYNYVVNLDASGHPQFSYINGSFTRTLTDSGTAVPLNTWTHLSFVVTGPTTSVNFYINDVFSSVQTNSIVIPGMTTGGAGHIGSDGASGNQLDGALDELQLYSGTPSANFRAMLYANENSPATFYTILSNVAWTGSCTMGLAFGGSSGSTMAFHPAAAVCGLVVGVGGPASLGYGSASAVCGLAVGAHSGSTEHYDSAKATIPLVIGAHALISIGDVPITCVTGDGSGGVVTPPSVDPGWAY